MSEPTRYFVDTNLLVRFFTRDNPEQGSLVYSFMERVRAGEIVAVVSDSVVFETVYVLSGRIYGIERPKIVSALAGFLASEGIDTIGVIDLQAVLRLYLQFPKLSFADCSHAWLAKEYAAGKLVTFDEDFDDMADIVRVDLRTRSVD